MGKYDHMVGSLLDVENTGLQPLAQIGKTVGPIAPLGKPDGLVMYTSLPVLRKIGACYEGKLALLMLNARYNDGKGRLICNEGEGRLLYGKCGVRTSFSAAV